MLILRFMHQRNRRTRAAGKVVAATEVRLQLAKHCTHSIGIIQRLQHTPETFIDPIAYRSTAVLWLVSGILGAAVLALQDGAPGITRPKHSREPTTRVLVILLR